MANFLNNPIRRAFHRAPVLRQAAQWGAGFVGLGSHYAEYDKRLADEKAQREYEQLAPIYKKKAEESQAAYELRLASLVKSATAQAVTDNAPPPADYSLWIWIGSAMALFLGFFFLRR